MMYSWPLARDASGLLDRHVRGDVAPVDRGIGGAPLCGRLLARAHQCVSELELLLAAADMDLLFSAATLRARALCAVRCVSFVHGSAHVAQVALACHSSAFAMCTCVRSAQSHDGATEPLATSMVTSVRAMCAVPRRFAIRRSWMASCFCFWLDRLGAT